METIVEAAYIAAGAVIFVLAFTLLLGLNMSLERSYDKVMYNSSKDEILWWLTDE